MTPCESLSTQLGAMFECTPHGEFVRVRTPFWYPDGGIVDLFLQFRGEEFIATDLGEALGWLKLQSIGGKRTARQQRLLQDVCLTLGVELFRGQLILRGRSQAELASVITRLGQAIVRVSDLWFTTRTRSVESVTDEVADFLEEQQIQFERGVKLAGRSGRDWTVDFHTRTDRRSCLVFVLASGARAGARRVVEHAVAGWHDLSPFRVGPEARFFVSLFDDTSDVWSEEDFRLAESLSEICRWSRPDEFVDLLKAA